MWFNNTIIYHYELKEKQLPDFDQLLQEEILKPCPAHARFIYGWLPTAEEMVIEVAGAYLICLGKEERLLPRTVINRLLTERIQLMEAQQNRTLKRAERAQLAEDLEFELLPKSFCIQKKTHALLDSLRNRLIINTSSANQASQVVSLLKKSIPGLQLELLNCQDNLASRFATWITNPNLIQGPFTLASDCLLFSFDDEKKRVNCKGYELPADEIGTLLSQGLGAAEISLIWNERIQFTLTQDFTIKRLKCLDYLIDEFDEVKQLEEEYQKRDAQLMLLSGELRTLIDDLLKLFSFEASSQLAEKACLA